MARDYFINGPAMVTVKGNVNSSIANVQQLGLSQDPIRLSPRFNHMDIKVDAWASMPPEQQYMLADVSISMNLVHVDVPFLQTCMNLSMGGTSTYGTLVGAGTRMGGNTGRFTATWNYISLCILSPVGNLPYRFYNCYLTGQPLEIPVGVERSVFNLNWRAVPYFTDPWNNGQGSNGVVLWDNTAD